MPRRILVIDDEPGIRSALGQLLEYEGYDVRTAPNAADGLAEYDRFRPHLTFMDIKMAGMDGLEALKRLKQQDADACVVMISGHATIKDAVDATQLGAYDILEKPLDTDRILVLLRNALDRAELAEENARLRETIEIRYEIVGKSYVIRALLDGIDKVAATPARVLITGENGTGKELVARAIHKQSQRKAKPFVEVNCAAIPSELIESELFGHMKGSFTGAVQDRAGKFEQADGGTLFLDEVGDMSPTAQAKVLRVLQDGVVTRIGGSKPIKVDVRVIAATNKELEEEIAAGRFREDLFYRLNVVPLRVPALRDRREDIALLVRHFLTLLARQDGLPAQGDRRCGAAAPHGAGVAGERARAAQHRRAAAHSVQRRAHHAGRRRAARRPPCRGRRRTRLAHGHRHVRGVQARRRARVSAREAAAVRLERVGDGTRARDAALERLQEDRAIRLEARRRLTTLTHTPLMSDRDWEKELAEIDRRIASEPAESEGVPASRTVAVSGRTDAAKPKPPSVAARANAPVTTTPAAPRHWKTIVGLTIRLSIAAMLLAAVVVWPYDTRCGSWLYGYLATIGLTAVASIWTAVAAWRHRGALVHLLSLAMLATALVYAAIEVLPRVGYALPDAAHPTIWSCG